MLCVLWYSWCNHLSSYTRPCASYILEYVWLYGCTSKCCLHALATNLSCVLPFVGRMCTCSYTWYCTCMCARTCMYVLCVLWLGVTRAKFLRGPYFFVICYAHDCIMWHNYCGKYSQQCCLVTTLYIYVIEGLCTCICMRIIMYDTMLCVWIFSM